MVVGDSGDAGFQALVDRGSELNRRAVRAHADRLAAPHAQTLGVFDGKLDLWRRPLELELRDALDGGAGEERPVAEQLERPAGRLGRDRFVGALGRSRLEGDAVR